MSSSNSPYHNPFSQCISQYTLTNRPTPVRSGPSTHRPSEAPRESARSRPGAASVSKQHLQDRIGATGKTSRLSNMQKEVTAPTANDIVSWGLAPSLRRGDEWQATAHHHSGDVRSWALSPPPSRQLHAWKRGVESCHVECYIAWRHDRMRSAAMSLDLYSCYMARA